MVEPVDTARVKTEEGGEEKRFSHFKKKNQGRNANAAMKQVDRDVPELLKGVEFSMDRNGPDLYIKAVEKLQLYASTTYKNGATATVSTVMVRATQTMELPLQQ